VRDQESIQAPRWTVNGLLSKMFDIGSNELTLSWSFDYVDDRYASVDNNRATFLKGSFVHNARIAYRLPDAGVEVAAFVNNLSDVDRQNFVYDYVGYTGSVIRSYAKPRWWGFSLRKDF
jgi:iron complex outermembrane receptor protein